MATLTALTIADQISVYEAARRQGVAFILANLNDDGSPPDPGRPRVTYYRLPWALAVSGETAAAHRHLAWIERTGIDDDGKVHGGVPWSPEANRAFASYAETCLAYGATLLRRFDLARRLMQAARQFQDPVTGGIFMDRDRQDVHGPQLLFLTAQFGMSAVMTGDLDAALRVGEWFRRLWEAQPDLPHRLFTVWTREQGLATEAPSGDDPRHYVNDARETRQYHYNGGIAAAALTHIGMATGDATWLELAAAYQRFSIETTARQFETKQVCKSAWGAGLLTLATGDDAYLPWLIRMGDWFAAEQEPDGGWSNTLYLDPEPPLAHRLEATAEFVVHLDTLVAALAMVASRRGLVG